MPHRTTLNGKILLVDDQPTNLRVVKALLDRHGYTVDTASDGESALKTAHETRPDLILLDMMMPGMDGFAFMLEAKLDPALMRVPVIFLTAAHDRDLLVRAFDAGAVDYVTKPFTPEELLARVSAHLNLKLARDRLERFAREKQDLVNLVAHDLKNPLSSILFASDMLVQPEVNQARVPRYLQIIKEATEDAIGYIRNYLETQKRGGERREESEFAQAQCSLNEVVEWLVDRYAFMLEAQGFELKVQLPREDCRVAVEGMVLRQVSENLMTNASKYARTGKVLDLSVRSGAEGYWQLLVEDRGPGISPSKQRELFKPFTRLTEEDPANGNSTGLGLSLARQIIMDLGGHLFYEDRDGGGARFVLELPAARG